jgi:hypothetical protein
MSTGQMPFGLMYASHLYVCWLRVRQKSVGKMSFSQKYFAEMYASHSSGDKMPVNQRYGGKISDGKMSCRQMYVSQVAVGQIYMAICPLAADQMA